MLGCLRDPAQLARIVDIGLCHGMAGLFQTAWRMAADTRTSDIAAELPRLSARLLRTDACSSPDWHQTKEMWATGCAFST
jgi:lantibiotic biosynthesis protein